jgi:hypothetical protein
MFHTVFFSLFLAVWDGSGSSSGASSSDDRTALVPHSSTDHHHHPSPHVGPSGTPSRLAAAAVASVFGPRGTRRGARGKGGGNGGDGDGEAEEEEEDDGEEGAFETFKL